MQKRGRALRVSPCVHLFLLLVLSTVAEAACTSTSSAQLIDPGCGDDVVCWDLDALAMTHTLVCSYSVSQVELASPVQLITGSIFSRKIHLWDLRRPERPYLFSHAVITQCSLIVLFPHQSRQGPFGRKLIHCLRI